MPKVSTKAVMKALANASSSRGSYVPKSLTSFLNKTRISNKYSGSERVKDALNKSNIEQKKLAEIFRKAKEEGVLCQTSSTRSEKEFYKAATKEERLNRQLDQKNQQNTKSDTNKTAPENQKIQAKNKQPETVKSEDKKASNIAQAQKETAKAERWRGAALGGKESIRGMERVYAGGEGYRKQQAATSGVLKSRGGGGMMTEERGGLIGHAKEEAVSPSASKGGKKSGSNISANKKAGGHDVVKLQDSAGIDQLTHPQKISNDEKFTGGVFHVAGLNKPSASQSETPPAPKDIDDLNIG